MPVPREKVRRIHRHPRYTTADYFGIKYLANRLSAVQFNFQYLNSVLFVYVAGMSEVASDPSVVDSSFTLHDGSLTVSTSSSGKDGHGGVMPCAPATVAEVSLVVGRAPRAQQAPQQAQPQPQPAATHTNRHTNRAKTQNTNKHKTQSAPRNPERTGPKGRHP